MHKFKLAKTLVVGLQQSVSNIKPKDINSIKELRLIKKIESNLSKSILDVLPEYEKIIEKRKEIIKKYQRKYQEDKENKEQLQKEMEEAMIPNTKKLEAFDKKYKDQETEVELSNKEKNKLNELFEESIKDNYTNIDDVVKIADALEID